MNPLVMVARECILGLLDRAPSETIRELLHILYNAGKDAAVETAAFLKSWRAVAGDPYNADLLKPAVEELFPKGIPDEHKAPPVVPAPAVPVAEEPAGVGINSDV